MQKNSLLIGFTAGLLVASSAALQAQNLKHGIGIIFGEPTGISYKHQLNQKAAIDTAAAWSLSNKNRFHIQADYVLHDYSLIQVKKGRLPLYYGVGGRVEFRENEKNRFGVRVPLGIDYYFAGVPIDIFAEIVPVVELFPDTDIDLEGAIGVRYWF